jgi:hypothetical protein
MKPHLVISFTTASFFLAAPLTPAGEPDFTTLLVEEPAPASDGWEFTLVPNVFLLGIDGDIEIASPLLGPISGGFDADFGDILDDLDAGFILAGEARRGRFSLQGDFLYLGVSPTGTTRLPGYDVAKLEWDAIIATGLATYRVWEEPAGFLDLGAGLRVFHSESDLRLIDSGGVAPTLTRRGEETVLDGVVAARLVYNLNPKWSVRVYGDIGGGDSDLTWQVRANLGYALNDRTIIFAGYRHLAYEFSSGRTDLDLSASGPQIGVAITF